MNKAKLIIIFVCIYMGTQSAILSAGSFLDNLERDAINEALQYLKMDFKDMGFNKDYVNRPNKTVDHWRLKIVDTILDNPMILPDYAWQITEYIKDSRGDVSAYLEKASRELEVTLPIVNPEPGTENLWKTMQTLHTLYGGKLNKKYRKMFKKLNPKLEKALSLILTGLMEIKPHVDKAFPNMSKKDWTMFRKSCIAHFAYKDDDVKSEEEEKQEAFMLLNFSDNVDYQELYTAAYKFSFFLNQARKLLVNYGSDGIHETKVYGNNLVCEFETPLGKVVVGGLDSSFYDLSAVIILDMGGDDRYSYQGVNHIQNKFSIIMDFNGNDFFDAGNENFVLGGSFAGLGYLEDLHGNDHYRAGSFTMGAALFGVGVLIDHDGDDVYEGDTCTQGAGAFGVGYLYDEAGEDIYRAALYAQGFAYTKGIGVIDDVQGNDIYYAGGKYLDNPGRFKSNYLSLSQGFSIGMRPYASGGIGVLVDSEGNDYYMTEVYGQGSSYWFSLGILLDEKGHDNYNSLQYSQGTGIHLSTGMLVDLDGNDKYTIGHLGQGSNHDLSVSFLLDKKGNDIYAGNSTVQGGALTNSVTVFIDNQGDDCYYARDFNNSQGNGVKRRNFGNIGIMLDLGGKDVYTTEGKSGSKVVKHPMKDDSYLLTGFYGISMDKYSKVPKTNREDK